MLRILAIGNSFSEDSVYYLHQILSDAGIENQVINLYIGGCPLERHWKNIERNARDYQYQVNGVRTDRYVSIQDVLKETTWDVIVTHQSSHDSGWMDTYEPFLGNLIAYLKKQAPGAKLFLNKTWAYEKTSSHEHFGRYNRSQQEMYTRLSRAYAAMAEKYELPLIPSGDLIQKLRETEYFNDTGKYSICRDGYHMHYLYGRYALGCMWAKAIAGVSLKANGFVPETIYVPYEGADMNIINMIKEMADSMEL